MAKVQHFIGIDGCKKGWLAIHYFNNVFSYQIMSSLNELQFDTDQNTRILIDMPLGLSSANKKRTIDKTLRQNLTARKSSVFNAPCREALYTKDYRGASELNRCVEGKGLSLQSFHLFPKIKELESFYLAAQSANLLISESHPEFCFQKMQTSLHRVALNKKTKEGKAERFNLVSHLNKDLQKLYNKVVSETKRKDTMADDILDAMVLCLCNINSGNNLRLLKDQNEKDELGIPIQIAF